MDKRKKIGYIFLVLTIIFTIIGSTFAYFTWRSSTNTNVTFTVTSGFSCSADGGGNITNNDVRIVPTDECNGEHAIKRTITTSAQVNTDTSIYMDLWLDVNDLGTPLSESQNFKYVITTNSNSCTTNIVKQGTFNGKEVGDKAKLLNNVEFPTTQQKTYYLYIWLDSAETNSNTMDQPFDFSLNGECTNIAPSPPSFADDDWDTIKENVSSGTIPYQVGDTKCVHVEGFSTTNNNGCNGDFQVRVANTSIPAECDDDDFSQSACGFVVEFVDMIDFYNIGGTAGGWPVSEMKTHLDTDIYDALPIDLKASIITTKTISGHGNQSGENYISDSDLLYLLSAHEVWEDDASNPVSLYDSSYNDTRQLDYYADLGVTTSNYSAAIKCGDYIPHFWWLRGECDGEDDSYLWVDWYGAWGSSYDDVYVGVSPAFRVG